MLMYFLNSSSNVVILFGSFIRFKRSVGIPMKHSPYSQDLLISNSWVGILVLD